MEKTVKQNGNEKVSEAMALIKRTDRENPSPQDIEALQQVFADVPEIYRMHGNLNRQVFAQILKKAAGGSGFSRAAAERYVAEMKTELGFETSTFLEKMLIEEILMRWVRLQVAEYDHKNTTYESHAHAAGLYSDKRLDAAQKRYLRAVETLAKVRRLIARTQADGARMYKDLLTGKKP